ncbi:hypothetical protein POM88_054219 [Heracleum sosnowskyi]|uniref:Helitron helicase-like domain-containing protein n=1 Tax=Heracleum sosnowskyi TaxID=360622 RepID=A0AAD8GMM4_9APIA|nr:hypothetical protein POM88_054219 [Heracleum sosnowskyi]
MKPKAVDSLNREIRVKKTIYNRVMESMNRDVCSTPILSENHYQSTPPASDSPRSNITKIRSTLPFKRKPSAAKSKFKVCTSTRKLTEQDFNVTEEENSDLYDDQIETSRIRDFTDTDEDFDSEVQCSDHSSTDDEEMDSDSENEDGCLRTANDVQHGKVGSKYQIPDEYASLGGPSAKCSKCNTLMWKEERVNKNVTKEWKRNHISASDEVAGIMVPSTDNIGPNRDIIIQRKVGGGFQRVSYIHPKLMALQYPILFPNGEDGYHNKILFQSTDPDSDKDRDMISMKDYYSYRFQVRENEGMTPRLSGRLFQQVFKLKLEQLLTEIKKKNLFGVCVGVMYVVEFQKRGLPHVHMLIWLDSASKKKLKENVDKFVSAEILDPVKDPVGYTAVKAFMVHGPCGLQNPKSPCMKDLKCIRCFPKKYCARTMFDDSGFPIYKRRRRRNRQPQRTDEPVDEIQAYFDGRYVCGAEAAYRIFGFPIHHRTLSVERLLFHLPRQRNCTFDATESLEKVAEREKERLSKLEDFFLSNCNDVNARKYTYDEIPQHYVWNDGERRWNLRKRGKQIGCLSYAHHTSGEVWFLRMLLTKVRGPTSF